MSLVRMYDYLDDRESDTEINTKVSTNTNLVKDKSETKAEVMNKCHKKKKCVVNVPKPLIKLINR